MGIADTFFHIANFFMPALVMAALLAPALVWGGPKGRGRSGRLLQAVKAWLALSGIGAAVLLGGLVAFGRDGRMATYGVLVLVLGTAVAAWRSRR
jgi:4-amino-4-deoxy-L-arabinose transferase-like glycosyltransferase